jgi:glycosyltransferase involved in cell wall biosynthesis
MKKRTEKASIIIPTFNKIERLRLVLEAFNYQSANVEDFEIVLVNDGSTDGTEEEIKKIEVNYKLSYLSQKNTGRSAARNLGITAANNPLLIFCDDDTIPCIDYIKEHISAHLNSEDLLVHGKIYNLPYLKYFKDPCRGILYPEYACNQINNLHKKLLTIKGIELLELIDTQKRITQLERQIISIFENNIHNLKWLSFTGGNASIKKKVLEKNGFFDNRFGKTWGGEDLELGYRLFLSGCHFSYRHEATCYHIAHVRNNYLDELKKSMMIFYSLHPVREIQYMEELLSGRVKEILIYCNLIESK